MGATVLWWDGNIHEAPVHSTTFQVCAEVTFFVIRGTLLTGAKELYVAGSIIIHPF